MICTVSTVKDSLRNVQQFVDRNLASGADHMFVFLDGGDGELEAYLTEQNNVTPIPTRKDYWRGSRPGRLNRRQAINANLINTLLAAFERVRWLIQIDGDECLDIDKARLLRTRASLPYVVLETREAVSQQHPEGDAQLFKQRLTRTQLRLLRSRGLIDRPDNEAYFNGHFVGKPGIAPSLDVDLHIHSARTRTGRRLMPLRSRSLGVLHYESVSGDEFIRKWTTHLSSGSGAKFRGDKDAIRAAVQPVIMDASLSEEAKRESLMKLYAAHVVDDVEALLDLGYLVRPAPEYHAYTPQPWTPDQALLVSALLSRLVRVDKRCYQPGGGSGDRREVLRAALGELGDADPRLATMINSCLDRSRGGLAMVIASLVNVVGPVSTVGQRKAKAG